MTPHRNPEAELAYRKKWYVRFRPIIFGALAVVVVALATLALLSYLGRQADKADADKDRAVAANQRAAASEQLAKAAKLQSDVAAKVAEEAKNRSVSQEQLASLRVGLCGLVWSYVQPSAPQLTPELQDRSELLRLSWRSIGQNPILQCPSGIKPPLPAAAPGTD